MLYYFPVVGWFFAFVFAFLAAIPFYFLWNALAPTYFTFMPAAWMSIPFWHCVELFMLAPLVRMLVPFQVKGGNGGDGGKGEGGSVVTKC